MHQDPHLCRESFRVHGRAVPSPEAHGTSHLVLFQGERPLQDPTVLALTLWNSMVSGWGSRGTALPAWGLVYGRRSRASAVVPRLLTALMEGLRDTSRTPR